MMHLFRDPLAIGVLLSTAVSIALSRTRLACWSLLSSFVVVVLGAEIGCFDGHPHLTAKFDATFLVWARAVELRAIGGLAISALGVPIGVVIAKLVRARRGAVMGFAIVAPFGLGLLASSVWLQLSFPALLDQQTRSEARLELLRTTVHQSTWLVGFGTAASVIACAVILIGGGRRSGSYVS